MRPALVDTSRWQGSVDAAAIKAAGFLGIVARCTIGLIYLDPIYKETQQRAKDEGLIFGAYHVLWPSNQQPRLEAEWFDEHAGEIDLAVEDVELTHGLSKRNVVDQAYEWFLELERWRAQTRKVCYTGSWWWTINQGPLEQEYDLWEAEYTRSAPRGGVRPDQAPQPPQVPVKLGPGWNEAKFWQWTSAGIPYGVESQSEDHDVFMGTEEELRAYLNLEVSPTLENRFNAYEAWGIEQGYIPPF